MGSPDVNYEEVAPVYDPVMQEYLNQLAGSLAGGVEGPEFVGSGGVQASAEEVMAMYDWMASGGQSDWVIEQANEYVDPAMVQGMVDSTTMALDQSLLGVDSAAMSSGSQNSSKTAIAQGQAAGDATNNLNNQMLDYYNQQIDRASDDFDAAVEGQMKQVQMEQYLMELQQGDINKEWMSNLMASNPAMLQALIYSTVANTSPMGGTVQTTS